MKQLKQNSKNDLNSQASQYEQLYNDTAGHRNYVNAVLNDYLENDIDTEEETFYTNDYMGQTIIDSCTLYNLDVRISVNYDIITMKYGIFISFCGQVEFYTTNALSLPVYIAMMMDAADIIEQKQSINN